MSRGRVLTCNANSNDFVFDYKSVFTYGSHDGTLNTFKTRKKYKSAFTYHSVSSFDEEHLLGQYMEVQHGATYLHGIWHILQAHLTSSIQTLEESGNNEKGCQTPWSSLQTQSDCFEYCEETWPSTVLRAIITYICYVVVIMLLPISVWFCLKKVHALERLVILRLGKLQPVIGPGFSFVLPVIDKWTRVDLQSKSFTVATKQLLTTDGGIVEASAKIEYRVSDVVHYVTRLHDQEHSLQDLGLHCLTNLVSEKDQDDLERNRELVNSVLKIELNQTVSNWGLEVSDVFIYPIKVLKAAEPVDALGTMISALKAVAMHSDMQSPIIIPSASTSESDAHGGVEERSSSAAKNKDMVSKIRCLIDTAAAKGVMDGISANFKLEIVGQLTRILFLTFQNGIASIFEGEQDCLTADVSVMLTEDNLEDFLCLKVSPAQAFMEGRIMVTGDWTLLKPLSKIFG